MNDTCIILVQISPLAMGIELSAPLVKMKFRSKCVRIVWDDDLKLFPTSRSGEIPDPHGKSVFYTRGGTAFEVIGGNIGNKGLSTKHFFDFIERESEKISSDGRNHRGNIVLPIVNIPTQDPSKGIDEGIPCLMRVYSGFRSNFEKCYEKINQSDIETTFSLDEAIFQVLPPISVLTIYNEYNLCRIDIQYTSTINRFHLKFNHRLTLEESLSGICELNNGEEESRYDSEVLHSFDTEIVRQMFLRMKKLLSEPITVSATRNSTHYFKRSHEMKDRLYSSIKQYWGGCHDESKNIKPFGISKRLMGSMTSHEGALTVYNNIHGSGKTALVAAIARSVLKCQAVHIINAPNLVSKFGSSADIGLQSLLHQIILSAAVKGCSNGELGTICIIIDHLENFVQSGRKADATLPALLANGTYFSEIVESIKVKRHFEAPKTNPFYDIGDTANYLVPVRVCIVGVLTCGDSGNHMTPIPALNTLGQNRCHLETSMSTKFFLRNKSSSSNDSKDLLFESIGGNKNAKLALEDVLVLDEQKRRMLTKFGLSLPTGILLYGPPGTGKTLLAKAISQHLIRSVGNEDNYSSNGKFFSINASDVICAEIGTSEKILTSIFDAARRNRPSVIFIDEFQALFTSRDNEDGTTKGSSSRLASTLLTLMDDIRKWRDANTRAAQIENKNELVNTQRVVVIAATNTPWMVDRAFLRSGRFDRVLHIGLPNLDERILIFQVHLRKMKLDPSSSLEEVSRKMAVACDGFSGADISNLVRAAAIRCILAHRSHVQLQDFIDAKNADICQPSSNPKLLKQLNEWKY